MTLFHRDTVPQHDATMCGIAGFNFSDKKLIKKMTDSLRHRGPDGEGQYVGEHVSLGHRRLSIIDLTPKGAQPMKHEHLQIVFNGEIYNFKDLKKRLQKKGHKFRSKSDTELLLHAYQEWGRGFVKKLEGQWAFVIYDDKKKELFLSRDHFGIVPLFYIKQAGEFLFASEIKAILQHDLFTSIDLLGLNSYFFQKYIPGDLTIYSQIKKLPAGHSAVYDLKNKSLNLFKYHKLEECLKKDSEIYISERLEKIETLLSKSITKSLLADVPVGTFLSGGLDSSLLSSFVSDQRENLKTFSISFPESSYDESSYGEIVAEHIGSNHQVEEMQVDDNIIEKVLTNLDQPFGDSSIIPTHLLAKYTKKQVTVALSGDGADEVFGGYDTYKAYLLGQTLPSVGITLLKPFASMLPVSHEKVNWPFLLKRFITRYTRDPQQRHLNNMATFTDNDRLKLLVQGWSNVDFLYQRNQHDDLTQVQILDIQNYLTDNILVKTDTAAMLASLEVRVPFLDPKLVSLVLSLPDKYKMNFYKSKILLKKIAESKLPIEIVNRKKRGFTVPMASWLSKSKLIQEYLLSEKYYDHLYLSYERTQELWRDHIEKRADYSRELWLVVVFNYWWWNS